ncbi:MAG: hypothetical protein D3923_06500, partial [Candidatus Electrothrix sp. AR3]|nr:hypothetical protein [Candidatus Electrothrix sp. AR3]
TPADYLDLHRQLLSKKMPCWHISRQAEIGQDVAFAEWGTVGPYAVIGRGVQLRRCVVWENAVIAPEQSLVDRLIASGAV